MATLKLASSFPVNAEMIIYRKATFNPRLTWSDPTGPVQWSGATARCELLLGKDERLVELTTENSGMALGATDGTMQFFISQVDTALITEERGTCRVYVTDSLGNTRLILRGTVTVED